MPIPWNLDVARSYWTERKFFILDNGPNATTRTEKFLKTRQQRKQQDKTELKTIQSQLHLTDCIPSSPNSPVSSLERWCKTLSWSKCESCNSIIAEKLLPSFTKLQKSEANLQCQCHNDRYVVPLVQNIPVQLRSLTNVQIEALRPFYIDCGQYKRMKYGYRKKTGIFRIVCSKESIERKIEMLPTEQDRAICTTALHFLLSNPDSSYKKYYDMRVDLLNVKAEPTIFDVYKWDAIECALWPNLYPYTSWCETIHDGSSDRKSSKISFLFKCLSSIIDYTLHFELLQFQFDRWLYKTITGAIHSSRNTANNSITAFQALQDKPFSKGYWDWQHRFLIDAVRQFGLPSLFITISPSEWSFPVPFWLEDIREKTGHGPTNLPFFETIHFLHVLEQVVRGFLCGSNDSKWSHHLFSYNNNRSKSNILTYFYRFEFQKRGTLHIHFLVWLKNIQYINYHGIRADIPCDDASLLHLVNKCQIGHVSSLKINEKGTHIDKESNVPLLKISHPSSAHGVGVRGYIDTILSSLKSSMDVQTINGKKMLMKYVSSYVSKSKESFHTETLYTSTLSPATTAFKYAMSLDIAEPEMWVLLSSRKISWTNATRKQYTIPLSPDAAASNVILQKYYSRPTGFESLPLLDWLRIVNETEAVPTRYVKHKVVLVGLRFCSIFNPAYFFQYLLVHFPHRHVQDICPPTGHSLPSQIIFFHKAHLLMATSFTDGSSFAATLEVYGHKEYFLKTISSFVQSLIDLNNLYRLNLLTSSHTMSYSHSISNQPVLLHGNQLVFYNYFKEMVEQREQCLFAGGSAHESDIDWKRFPVVLGKPGTGKSFTMQECIQFSIDNDLKTCVATPTGTLACTYKDLYGDKVTCDTIHSLFFFKCHSNMSSSVNSSLSLYDVIFIDEISQVSKDLFHHVIHTLSILSRRPILILCGDFCQQQPLSTRNNKTVQAENIMSCSHCISYLVRFTLSQQHRIQDDILLNFLHYIRYDVPTQDMIDKLCKDRILSDSDILQDNLYNILKPFPDSLVLTVTRRSASFVNDVIVRNAFQQNPLALVVADDESLIPIHKDMKLMLTRNVNKSIGFVNGQFVTVKSISNKTIIAIHPNGHVINLFPMTSVFEDILVTKYPFLPGYATTISKVQGQTLSNVILWLDTERTPEGTAYVALSRVHSLNDLHFLVPLTPTHFNPVRFLWPLFFS